MSSPFPPWGVRLGTIPEHRGVESDHTTHTGELVMLMPTQKMIFGGGSFGIVNFFSRGDTPSTTNVSHGTFPCSVMVTTGTGACGSVVWFRTIYATGEKETDTEKP
jgi:hypothetical protein